jgi:adenylate kinase family enzyme
VERISVIGSSGSGKTTVARAIAEALDLTHVELDSVFHLPGWQQKPDSEFREEVARLTAGDRWVVDGNYASHGVADIVWPRADTVVWLDPSRPVVMRRVVGRTLRRVVTREELWNGNREPWTNLYSRDPYKNIIVWAWTRFEGTREKCERRLVDGSWDHLQVVRLRTAGQTKAFLAGLTERPPAR